MTSHIDIDPAILYFGTPVALLSTLNEDGTTNLMPMSSVFWLGRTAVLGVGASSQTARNLRDRPEIVINLPSVDLVGQVDRLALTTGSAQLSPAKAARGYAFVADKYARAGLTPYGSETVLPTSVAECPVHLEGRVSSVHDLGAPKLVAVEVGVTAVRVAPELRLDGHPHRIDPDRWRPLMMSFQHFYGLGDRVHPSSLASIDEELYR
ncbi:flavin reductase (DIM6/NTAB) family NADH-FMN oxidoreductase RutF [Nocardioides albertanoniae]|uniref:Flavin reductase (DIM6/NTAB) family NADH-FMN oxidoreductase RutF n=1 Tax=Nocardioides albertanoniae TaxID=1175486 RepID=A0A543A8Z3_9ACTN|nr:flavin reductase family protein [Nocardioides albertanoniae]TQL69067.1 flavin reductase (DIM6/NTAB) family NADH-FMN oxidoreductase RutF [Nocardioides albertanoniae]